MAQELSRSEVRKDEDLLIEAVSLLVERQREMEAWVAEQVLQVEERAATAERRYADLEARLVAIEDQLNRLVQDFEPDRRDAGVDERLARLREEVESLKSGREGQPVRSTASVRLNALLPPPPATEPRQQPQSRAQPRSSADEPNFLQQTAPRTAAVTHAREVDPSFGRGPRPLPRPLQPYEDKFGLVLIGVGAVAVLYAIVSQLRFG